MHVCQFVQVEGVELVWWSSQSTKQPVVQQTVLILRKGKDDVPKGEDVVVDKKEEAGHLSQPSLGRERGREDPPPSAPPQGG